MARLRLKPAPSRGTYKKEKEGREREKKNRRVRSGEPAASAPGARKYVEARGWRWKKREKSGEREKERVLRARGAIYHRATKQPTPDESCICIDGPTGFPLTDTIVAKPTRTHTEGHTNSCTRSSVARSAPSTPSEVLLLGARTASPSFPNPNL